MKIAFSVTLMTIVLFGSSAKSFSQAIIGTNLGRGADTTIANDESDGGDETNQFFADDVLSAQNTVGMRMFVDDIFLDTIRHRVGLLRFDLTGLSGDFTDAHFEFHSTNQGRLIDFFVLNDTDETTENWDESTISYNTAPGLTGSQPYPTSYVDVDPTKVTEIGSWAVPGPNSGDGFPVNFTVVSRATPEGGAQPGKVYADTILPDFSVNLASAIAADTNNLLTVIMILSGADDPGFGGNNGNVEFLSKEGLVADMNAEMPLNYFFNPSLVLPNAMLEVPMGLVGDYNNDDVVDAADYTVWRDSLNGDGLLLGDNRDPANMGVVSQADYDSWKANFGAVAGGTGAVSVVAVPEPASWLLACAVVLMPVAARRRIR